MTVVPEKAHAGADHGAAEDCQLSGASDIGDFEVLGNDCIPAYIRKNHVRYRYDKDKPYGKPVKAISQINGI